MPQEVLHQIGDFNCISDMNDACDLVDVDLSRLVGLLEEQQEFIDGGESAETEEGLDADGGEGVDDRDHVPGEGCLCDAGDALSVLHLKTAWQELLNLPHILTAENILLVELADEWEEQTAFGELVKTE